MLRDALPRAAFFLGERGGHDVLTETLPMIELGRGAPLLSDARRSAPIGERLSARWIVTTWRHQHEDRANCGCECIEPLLRRVVIPLPMRVARAVKLADPVK